MNVIMYPKRNEWSSFLQRPVFDNTALQKKVRRILDKVNAGGDKAVKKYIKEFDKVSVRKLQVTDKEMKEAGKQIPDSLRKAIITAKNNIEKFHAVRPGATEIIETMPGIKCWRKSVPIERVGLYIPGGTAPLFSTVLMLAVPAKLAGCKEIVLCSPPQKDGSLHPAILFAATISGVTKIYKTGGIQAIGAMAYGTETIPQVFKVFGPGNQYVNCAKQLIQSEGIAIDMPAGPSEVCVLADETAEPSFIAADLLSQAEHGPDSQVLLITTSLKVIEKTKKEIKRQIEELPRKEIAMLALTNSRIILVKEIDEAVEMINEYAPEHLIICYRDGEQVAERIINAGSVFLGNYSPESVGDYASGTNHTLPTNGYARAYSGVSVDSFVKKITYQQLTQQGLKNIGEIVMEMASAEGLIAHANAVRVRLKNSKR